MGTAAAYHFARRGSRTLLVEQFEIGHSRGSSHGGSRIIRYTHPTAGYARLIEPALALWRTLEAEAGERLLRMTGGLYIAPPGDEWLTSAIRIHDALGHRYQLFSGAELPALYPQFCVPPGWRALYHEGSGILSADRCVLAMARLAQEHGAELRERTQVTALEADGAGVIARLAGPAGQETVSAAQAVVCAGPWASHFARALLPWSLPLRVTGQQVAYFPVTQPELYAPGRCPIFIFTGEPHFYGFPIWERPGLVKIAEEYSDEADPNRPTGVNATRLEKLGKLVAGTLAGVAPQPVAAEPCLYTETPTRDFVIDRHPETPQILFAAGFSGRGFKFSIAVGALLADLAATPPGTYASPFWLDEFRLTPPARPHAHRD